MPLSKRKETYQSIEREDANFGTAMKAEKHERPDVSHGNKILFFVGSFLLIAVMAFRSGSTPGDAALLSQAMEEFETAERNWNLGNLSDDAFVTQGMVEFGNSSERGEFNWIRKGGCGVESDWLGWFYLTKGGSARCAAACAENDACGYFSVGQIDCHLYNKSGDCPEGGASNYESYRVHRLTRPKCIDFNSTCNDHVPDSDSTSCSNCCNPQPASGQGICANGTISPDYLKNKYPAIKDLNKTERTTALDLYQKVATNGFDNHIVEFVTGHDPKGVKRPPGQGGRFNEDMLDWFYFIVRW